MQAGLVPVFFKVGRDFPICTCLREGIITEGEDEDIGGGVWSHRRRMSGGKGSRSSLGNKQDVIADRVYSWEAGLVKQDVPCCFSIMEMEEVKGG